MLDKSIPYKSICMRLPAQALQRLPSPTLPEGYSFEFYRPGRMADWARIETSVLEFPSEQKAQETFARDFLPYEPLLETRMCFVCNPNGLPIAGATAWSIPRQEKQLNCLHWVAVQPGHQGLGLGRAIVLQALSRFRALGEEGDVFLHTQTWSHVAVRLYHSLGFVMQDKDAFSDKDMPLQEALEILSWRLSPQELRSLRETAE